VLRRDRSSAQPQACWWQVRGPLMVSRRVGALGHGDVLRCGEHPCNPLDCPRVGKSVIGTLVACCRWQAPAHRIGHAVGRDARPWQCAAMYSAHRTATIFFLDAGAMNLSTKGAIITGSIAWAVLRFRINSNFVGCSTGKSAVFAPFAIPST
jgi:hypothetical protein